MIRAMLEGHRVLVVTGGTLALALWASGLWLFVHAPLPGAHKLTWALFLLLVGVVVGSLLGADEIIQKLVWALMIVPVLAVVDVRLFHSQRGVLFWVRACGFEVCSVFGVALATRFVAGMLRLAPLLHGRH